MKVPFVLVGVIIAGMLTGCYQDYYEFKGSITDVPIKQPVKNVELYFADDQPSDSEFIKISIIKVTGRKYETYDELVDKLRLKAASVGFDGVIKIQKGTTLETNTSFADILSGSEGEKYTANVLSGFGIKYIKNMDYITRYKKSETIYEYRPQDTSFVEMVAEIRYKLNGEIDEDWQKIPGRNSVYNKYIRPYSLEYLVDEKQNWAYKVDNYGKMISRRKSDKGLVQEKCKFEYGKDGRLALIKVYDLINTGFKYFIRLSYDTQGRISSQEVYETRNPIMWIKINYDQEDRKANSKYYIYRDSRFYPYLMAEYGYYNTDDLRSNVLGLKNAPPIAEDEE
jgi:hypothetical protein